MVITNLHEVNLANPEVVIWDSDVLEYFIVKLIRIKAK